MAVILCLETSTVNCSVAIFKDGILLAIREEGESYVHAEKLHVFIQEVLQRADIKPGQLDAVAVGQGPGSFTGLRIGVAAAKGICYATSAKLISVPGLRTMSRMAMEKTGLNDGNLLYCPMIDARRQEVYCALFDNELNEVVGTHAHILDENSYKSQLEKGRVLFFGDGMMKWKERCSHPHASFPEGVMPSSRYMEVDASVRFEKGEYEDVAYFEPYYLKDFQPTTPGKKL